jgi:hypothetical protein
VTEPVQERLHLTLKPFNVDKFGPRPFVFLGRLVYARIYLAFALATTAWPAWLMPWKKRAEITRESWLIAEGLGRMGRGAG